jgi:hypothetical protein
MRAHFGKMVRHRSEYAAVREFRQRISWYAKGMGPCRPMKDAMREI